MPASGQFVGKDAIVQVQDSGGTLRLLSTDVNNSSWTWEAETPESTTYGKLTRTMSASGLRNWSFTFDGLFSDTATTGAETVLSGIGPGGSTMITWGPAGSTSGFRKYSGCAVLKSYQITVPFDGLIKITAQFVPSAGSLTLSTY